MVVPRLVKGGGSFFSSEGGKAWMKNEFKLGAEAGLTVAVIGSNAEAAATTNANANANVDIIAWSKAKGVTAESRSRVR